MRSGTLTHRYRQLPSLSLGRGCHGHLETLAPAPAPQPWSLWSMIGRQALTQIGGRQFLDLLGAPSSRVAWVSLCGVEWVWVGVWVSEFPLL